MAGAGDAPAAVAGLRDPVTCLLGYAGLVADAAAHGERPHDAWLAALDVNAGRILAAFAELERALAES